MKIYGYTMSGVLRGELVAAMMPLTIVTLLSLDGVACELYWERAFSTFAKARRELLREMEVDGVDPDLIRLVRGMHASYVPIVYREAG